MLNMCCSHREPIYVQQMAVHISSLWNKYPDPFWRADPPTSAKKKKKGDSLDSLKLPIDGIHWFILKGLLTWRQPIEVEYKEEDLKKKKSKGTDRKWIFISNK